MAVKGDEPFMQGYGVPAPYADYHNYPKVCIYDITDPTQFDENKGLAGASAGIPTWTLLLPVKGFANQVELIEFSGRTWMFVTLFDGDLFVYDITEIHSESTGALEPSAFPPFEHFVVSADKTDPFRSDLYGVVLDKWLDEEEEELALYAYLGTSRVGVEILRLLPEEDLGDRLAYVALLQVPGEAGGMWIREVDGERQILVANTYAGIRIYDYGQVEVPE